MQIQLTTGIKINLDASDKKYKTITLAAGDTINISEVLAPMHCYIELPDNHVLCSNQDHGQTYLINCNNGKVKSLVLPTDAKRQPLLIKQMTLMEDGALAYLSINSNRIIFYDYHSQSQLLYTTSESFYQLENINCLLALPGNQLAIGSAHRADAGNLHVFRIENSAIQYNYSLQVPASTKDDRRAQHPALMVQALALTQDLALNIIAIDKDWQHKAQYRVCNLTYDRHGQRQSITWQTQAAPTHPLAMSNNSLHVGLTSAAWHFLPTDLWVEIASNLNWRDLFTLVLVSKWLLPLKTNINIWRPILRVDTYFTDAEVTLESCIVANDEKTLTKLIDAKLISYANLFAGIDDEFYPDLGLLGLAIKLKRQTLINLLYKKIIIPFFINNKVDEYGHNLLMLTIICRQKLANPLLLTMDDFLQKNDNDIDALSAVVIAQDYELITLILYLLKEVYDYSQDNERSDAALGQLLDQLRKAIYFAVASDDNQGLAIIFSFLAHEDLADLLSPFAIEMLENAVNLTFESDKAQALQYWLGRADANWDYLSLLFKAVQHNASGCLQILLQDTRCNPELLNTKNESPRLLLDQALARENYKIIQLLVDKGASFQPSELWRISNLKVIQLLVKMQAFNISCLLSKAANAGHTDIVNYLIQQGADCHYVVDGGYNVLHKAIYDEITAKVACVDLILQAAPELTEITVTADNIDKGSTPLLIAARKGNHVIIELLINKYQANIHWRNDKGENCIDLAVAAWRTDAAMWLLQHTDVAVTQKTLDALLKWIVFRDYKPLHYMVGLKYLIQTWQSHVSCQARLFAIDHTAKIKLAQYYFQQVIDGKLPFVLDNSQNLVQQIEVLLQQKLALNQPDYYQLRSNRAYHSQKI